jgi:uncharacterized protein YaiI (UPF0178 family)
LGGAVIKILVDADACPNTIKEILFRASQRLKIPMTLVANQNIAIPKSTFINFVLVGQGFDVADQHIVLLVNPGDLVITADIPLAAGAIEKGGFALNPRGEFYTKDNMRQKLSIRNFMEELRGTGQVTGGPAPLNKKDNIKFANALDQFLARR